MLTDIIFVRGDWTGILQKMRRDQRRIFTVATAVMLLATAGVFVTLSWQINKGVESFVSEALSYGLFLAAPVWFAFRHQSGGWRKAIAVYFLFLAIMFFNDWVMKQGLEGELVSSFRASDPRLCISVSMLLIWLVPLWMVRAHPEQAISVGLNFRQVRQQVLYGFLGAAILIAHLWVTLGYSGLSLSMKPWPYVLFMLCYELSAQSLTEELFFRGFLFNYLHGIRQGGLWRTASLVSFLNVLIYLVKLRAPSSPYEMIGSVFYVFAMAMVNALLYRRWGGILSGLVLNVLFSMGGILR